MKAIRVHQYGGPEVMGFEDITLPEPGQGEARILYSKLTERAYRVNDRYARY